MKPSALSATSRQPWSMTSACPRSGISTISVTPSFRFCLLYVAFEMAHGTVWSFSPEMISRGPRWGFLLSTRASVQGLRLAVAAWKRGTPDAGKQPATESCGEVAAETAPVPPGGITHGDC